MTLELKHLSGYLPYGLKVYRENKSIDSDIFVIVGASKTNVFLQNSGLSVVDIERIKPILRPLSDLTKEIEVCGEKFVPLTELLVLSNFDIDKMTWNQQLEFVDSFTNTLFMTFEDAQKLLEWHFDIHGLIEKGLAIDINTLNK